MSKYINTESALREFEMISNVGVSIPPWKHNNTLKVRSQSEYRGDRMSSFRKNVTKRRQNYNSYREHNSCSPLRHSDADDDNSVRAKFLAIIHVVIYRFRLRYRHPITIDYLSCRILSKRRRYAGYEKRDDKVFLCADVNECVFKIVNEKVKINFLNVQ